MWPGSDGTPRLPPTSHAASLQAPCSGHTLPALGAPSGIRTHLQCGLEVMACLALHLAGCAVGARGDAAQRTKALRARTATQEQSEEGSTRTAVAKQLCCGSAVQRGAMRVPNGVQTGVCICPWVKPNPTACSQFPVNSPPVQLTDSVARSAIRAVRMAKETRGRPAEKAEETREEATSAADCSWV